MHSKINVLIVDDSLFIRTYLNRVLSADESIGTVKMANDGAAALSMLTTYKPDVITLDVEMPRMNGLETLSIIKKRYNIPVIMVSALTRKGADITIKSLELGAIDWIQKPDDAFDLTSHDRLKLELLQKIQLAVKKDGISLQAEKLATTTYSIVDKDNITKEQFLQFVKDSNWVPKGNVQLNFSVVAIGISTGGPSALNQIIPMLPEDLNAAVIIVQHMPSTFTKVLAERLNDISKMNVKEAEDEDVLEGGYVYIIPGDKHFRIKEEGRNTLKIKLDSYAKVGGFRPSAETLFYFAAEAAKNNSIGIIMTGMGNDGSENIGLIKKYSEKTIAQDEESCVIFGMPKAAINKGNINFVLPLNKIVDKIKELVIK